VSAPDLESSARTLWAAYEYLKDNDLSEMSSTSRLLHGDDAGYPRARLAQELQELAGAITGEHMHYGLPQDLLLEGSQVLYWLVCTALLSGAAYENLPLHTLLVDVEDCPPGAQECADNLRRLSAQLSGEDHSVLEKTMRQVGCSALVVGVDAGEIVEYDLAEMKKRPYMAPYFSSGGSG
jgi:hypothetical protein